MRAPMQPWDRRSFLVGAGSFVVVAGMPTCAVALPAAKGTVLFPHGVASGDPTPDSVVLWTRAVPRKGASGIDLILEVAETDDFTRVLVSRTVRAGADSDRTVRVLVEGLQPDRAYVYRFRVGGDVSITGHTRTAPTADATRSVRLALGSCQNREQGYYGAWRRMILDDEAAPADRKIDFVLFVGDFIYEVTGYGSLRKNPAFPSGGKTFKDGKLAYAATLDDYRHLYRTYLSDPDLIAARARWPFVCVWDDHEFSDDCWQSAQTYGPEPEPAQTRRVACSRAWFEYVPQRLTGAPVGSGGPGDAHDFVPVTVVDAPFGATPYAEPNNKAAIGAIAIWRSQRWGKHVELVLSDLRQYRSPHPVPPALGKMLAPHIRYLQPVPVIELCDAGKTANGGNPPATLSIFGKEIPNPARDREPGTMMGTAQKAWWKRTMQRSDATWKLWATSVPVQPLRIDLDSLDPNAAPVVFSTDGWEGYPGERRELLQYLAAEKITGVVALSGDHHMHFAGLLAPDSAIDGAQQAVAAEFVGGGISSTSLFTSLVHESATADLRSLVTYDARPFGGTEANVEALNITFTWGAKAAMVAAKTGDVAAARAARNPKLNPLLALMDSNSHGYVLVRADQDAVEAELVTIEPPHVDRGAAGANVLRRAQFRLPRWRDAPVLEGPLITGTPPFPQS